MFSEQNASIYSVVKRYAEAWLSNDLAAAGDLYHDEIAFHYFGRSPLAGAHRGKSACFAVLKQVREKTNRKLISIQDVLAGEQFGLIIALERFELGIQTGTKHQSAAPTIQSWSYEMSEMSELSELHLKAPS